MLCCVAGSFQIKVSSFYTGIPNKHETKQNKDSNKVSFAFSFLGNQTGGGRERERKTYEDIYRGRNLEQWDRGKWGKDLSPLNMNWCSGSTPPASSCFLFHYY